MIDLDRELRALLEEDARRAPPVPDARPALRRTRRRQIAVVLTAIAVVAAVAIGSTAGAIALLRAPERQIPANPSETPTPAPGEPARPQDLDLRFDVAAAWGEVDGVGWTIWTNDDLSCMAFTTANGDYAGLDIDSCGNGYDGSDLTLAGICVYSCPDPGRPILYGAVSQRAAAVELALDDGSTYAGTIHPAPPGITVDARVVTVPVPLRWGSYTGWLTATGTDGAVLERIRYPENADAAGGPSMPIAVEATLASGVPVSEVDGRPSEMDRWEIAVWRNAANAWCLGTIYPYFPSAVVATEGGGCGSRDRLVDRIRTGAIGHADVWWTDESSMFGENAHWFRYRTVGTVSTDVASVRIEVGDGQVVDAVLYDPLPGFEDMGRLFVAEFRAKDHPWEFGGEGGITWRAVALGADGEALGSDEINL